MISFNSGHTFQDILYEAYSHIEDECKWSRWLGRKKRDLSEKERFLSLLRPQRDTIENIDTLPITDFLVRDVLCTYQFHNQM